MGVSAGMRVIAACAIVLACSAVLLAASFERPRTFAISAIPGLKAADDNYTIAEPVRSDGLLRIYSLTTPYGDIAVHGDQMLRMRLVELAQHSGISPAMLSRLESGRVFPTLPSLLKIAMVFNLRLEHFFAEDPRTSSVGITRAGERLRMPERFGGRETICSFQSLTYTADQPRFSAYKADFTSSPEGKVNPHAHAGFEMLYVTLGKLAITVAGEVHILGKGDSIYFDSSMQHSYRRVDKQKCEALVVTSV